MYKTLLQVQSHIYVHIIVIPCNSCNIGLSGLPDIYTLAQEPRVYICIRQTMSAHVMTNICHLVIRNTNPFI